MNKVTQKLLSESEAPSGWAKYFHVPSVQQLAQSKEFLLFLNKHVEQPISYTVLQSNNALVVVGAQRLFVFSLKQGSEPYPVEEANLLTFAR